MNVAIVDDHPVVREGLAAALSHRGFTIAGAFGSAEELLRARFDAEVVLLDLELPGLSGVDAVARVGKPVLVLTAYANDEQIDAVLRAGARGYLLKGAALDEIERAIRAVAAGQTYLDPKVASRVVALRGAPRLSAREREVLRHVAAGRSNKEIAGALAIAERTVKFHVTAIFNKLGADIRAELVEDRGDVKLHPTLGDGERTVKFHVTAIFNKLGAENRAQAVALAMERGLV